MNLGESVWESVLPNDHEDHIAEKGFNPLRHKKKENEIVPMLQEMKIPDAKAAVDKEWEKLEKLPAWPLTKVNSKKKGEVILEAEKEQRTVHCYVDRQLSSQECGVGAEVSKVHRSGRAPR